MSNNDGITDDVRKREDDYFRRKDRELIERMRHASELAQARKAMADETGIHDPALLEDLQQLGFTPETIALLPLVPVLKVAWAEGGVSTAERKAICDLARARGIAEGSAADQQLTQWLNVRPSAADFSQAMRLAAALVDHPGEGTFDVTSDDLLQYCQEIAHASGGLFGIGSVSAEEQAAMQEISRQLKKR